MALPVKPLPASSVVVNGSSVSFRSLSRAEGLHLVTFQNDPDAAEVFVISKACDVSEEEAQAFRDSSTVDEGGKLTNAILIFSGLAPGDGDDPKASTNELS